jgi:hypothetical protein
MYCGRQQNLQDGNPQSRNDRGGNKAMEIIVEITIAMRHLVVGGVLLCFR